MQLPPVAIGDGVRGVHVAPVRHHSPACAAQLERMLADVRPAAILIEGPREFEALIPLVADPATVPPVAIVAMRRVAGVRRTASHYPLCAHSPEFVALRAGIAAGIPVRFIDLPTAAAEMHDVADDRDRSLMRDDARFDAGDYIRALTAALGVRDGNEAWDTLFESRIGDGDWRRFFGDVAQYCACLRAATDGGTMERDGTLAREAQMRACLAAARAEVDGPIVAVVGGFHAAALLEDGAPAAIRTGPPGDAFLIRYGNRQLNALAGYAAGLPLPGYYDAVWRRRHDAAPFSALARDLIGGFAAHLRTGGGGTPAFPIMVGAIEHAERLAMLRGRPGPMRTDLIDAVRATFVRDEVAAGGSPLLRAFDAFLTGAAIGDVPPSAVIAARRHFGLAAGEAEPRAEAGEPVIVPRADPAFLAQVEAALRDCAGVAFNLAPEPVEEALFTLSVSSRADALPRLGRILRTLAGQLRRKRARDFAFDPDACLELLATGFALVRALGREDAATPGRRALLAGVVRRHYAPSAPVTVVGCGSDLWRTPAGARGVTGIFYEPAADRWLVSGPARAPGQDSMFDPATAYRTHALWGGQTLENAAGQQLRIEGAGISDMGRISDLDGARAYRADGAAPDRTGWPARIDDWAGLHARLTARRGTGVADGGRVDYALLAPDRFAAPLFDDLAQESTWPVADRAGRWIGLTVGHDAVAARRRAQIEELGRRRWTGEVLVRADPVGGRIVLTPIAVLAGPQSFSLGLDRLPEAPERRKPMPGWLWPSPARSSAISFTRAAPGASSAVLAAAWQQLIDLAETGLDRVRPAQLDRLRAAGATCDAMGMPTVAAALDALAAAPRARFLATGYALLVARQQRRDLPWLVSR